MSLIWPTLLQSPGLREGLAVVSAVRFTIYFRNGKLLDTARLVGESTDTDRKVLARSVSSQHMVRRRSSDLTYWGRSLWNGMFRLRFLMFRKDEPACGTLQSQGLVFASSLWGRNSPYRAPVMEKRRVDLVIM